MDESSKLKWFTWKDKNYSTRLWKKSKFCKHELYWALNITVCGQISGINFKQHREFSWKKNIKQHMKKKTNIFVPYVFYPVHPSLTVDHKPQKLVSTGILLYGVFSSNGICQKSNETKISNCFHDLYDFDAMKIDR